MGLGTREILITLGILLVVAILLDGVRRVRNARSGDLRMGRRKEAIFDDSDTATPELPTGEVRIIAVRDENQAAQRNQEIRETATKAKFGLDTATREPRQESLNLAPLTASRDGDGDDGDAAALERLEEHERRRQRAVTNDAWRADDADHTPARQPEDPDQSPLLVIHAMAPPGELYPGDALLDTLLAHDMRYGNRRIFHRHADADGRGPVLFSMANAVTPGDFDLEAMAEFETPGVAFLLMIADVEDPQRAFIQMLEVAQGVVEALGGDLKDETRSALTNQTIEHCRQRIRDYALQRAAEHR